MSEVSKEVFKKYDYCKGNTTLNITIFRDLTFNMRSKTLFDECFLKGNVHYDVLKPSWKFVDEGEIGIIKTGDGDFLVAINENLRNFDEPVNKIDYKVLAFLSGFVFGSMVCSYINS